MYIKSSSKVDIKFLKKLILYHEKQYMYKKKKQSNISGIVFTVADDLVK